MSYVSRAINEHEPTPQVPAVHRPAEPDDPSPACPWCDSPRVERVGAIGSHLMVSQYICLACRSPFEWIRR